MIKPKQGTTRTRDKKSENHTASEKRPSIAVRLQRMAGHQLNQVLTRNGKGGCLGKDLPKRNHAAYTNTPLPKGNTVISKSGDIVHTSLIMSS